MLERKWSEEDRNYPKDHEYHIANEPLRRSDGITLLSHESPNGYFKVELSGTPLQWAFTPSDLLLIGEGDTDRAKLLIAKALADYDVEKGIGGEAIFVDIVD